MVRRRVRRLLQMIERIHTHTHNNTHTQTHTSQLRDELKHSLKTHTKQKTHTHTPLIPDLALYVLTQRKDSSSLSLLKRVAPSAFLSRFSLLSQEPIPSDCEVIYALRNCVCVCVCMCVCVCVFSVNV